MTTHNGTPVEETSMEVKDATNWAADIVNTAINMRAHTKLSGAALRLWETAVPLFETERWSGQHRQAVKLSLDALIMQPEVLAWVAREARDHLVKVEASESRQRVIEMIDTVLDREEHAADALYAIADKLPAHVPLAVNHQIDGLGLELRPDGELTIEHPPQRMVCFTPREAYALLMFFRSPAVVALLEAQSALRMTASEIAFQNDPETIAERAAQMQAA